MRCIAIAIAIAIALCVPMGHPRRPHTATFGYPRSPIARSLARSVRSFFFFLFFFPPRSRHKATMKIYPGSALVFRGVGGDIAIAIAIAIALGIAIAIAIVLLLH